jgi:hypothetical protein
VAGYLNICDQSRSCPRSHLVIRHWHPRIDWI